MRRTVSTTVALLVLLGGATAAVGAAPEQPPRAEPTACDRPAGDPDPAADPDAWRARDQQNTACARQRGDDQQANPAYLAKRDEVSRRMYGEAIGDQLADPTRPRLTAPYLLPVNYYPGDPFRVAGEWAGNGRGRTKEVRFVATSGAHLRGRLYAPPASVKGPYPAVVFTTGSVQGFAEAYNAFYQGLAEEGYVVLSYDVQGQGRSESLSHTADGAPTCEPQPGGSSLGVSVCRGIPFQQEQNFYQGTRDAIAFMLSTPASTYVSGISAAQGANGDGTDPFNPWHALVDRDRLGIAGHSLGAAAVSQVGQEDLRVDAVVGYDGTSPASGLGAERLHAPALAVNAEGLRTPQDPASPPDPEGGGVTGRQMYDQLKQAGLPTGILVQRSSAHNESSYGGSSSASRYGERTAFAWTLAWFDAYVKGDRRGLSSLRDTRFDDSADRSSIGAGTYIPQTRQNVPYRIAGDCVADRVSIYFRSALYVGDQELRDLRARRCA